MKVKVSIYNYNFRFRKLETSVMKARNNYWYNIACHGGAERSFWRWFCKNQMKKLTDFMGMWNILRVIFKDFILGVLKILYVKLRT